MLRYQFIKQVNLSNSMIDLNGPFNYIGFILEGD